MNRLPESAVFEEVLSSAPPAEIKPRLQRQKVDIIESYPAPYRGIELARALSDLYDSVIDSAVRRIFSKSAPHSFCCVATGGYGRRELNIHSDIDLVFLYEDAEYTRTEGLKGEIDSCIRHLWDIGLEVGHSVRTPGEYKNLADSEHDVRTSMLELRWVSGNRAMFEDLEKTLIRKSIDRDPQEFLRYRLGVLSERHKKHGGSDRILEPHVKEGAGGLRDLHLTFWAGKVWLWMQKLDKHAHQSVDCLSLIANLKEAGNLTSDYAVDRSMEFLLTTRNALHQIAHRQQDVLTYPLQERVSRLLGYEDQIEAKGVEQFMRDYYRHARNINQFSSLVRDKIRKSIESSPDDAPMQLKAGFQIVNRKLYFVDSFTEKIESNPSLMTKAFLLAQQYDVSLSEALLVSLRENVDRIDDHFRGDRNVAKDFLEIWKSEGKVGSTLDRMHACGFLERYLPEFGYVVAHYNYNVYHYYTTDEHLIVSVKMLETLFFDESDSDPATLAHLRAIYDELTLFERYQLYWAMFLHDIGKSRGGDHSEIGVVLARNIFERLGYRDNADAVYFLILNHLRMEQTAFRRNLKDEETIHEFARLVADRRRLRLLYLMTFADISAANKAAWTEWKGALLMELFTKTDKFLKAAEGSTTFSIEDWEQLDYNTIRLDGDLDVKFVDRDNYTEVLVITSDVPYRLSQICGVMAVSDAGIFDANVFTRNDGVIIDQFKVTDFASHGCISDQQRKKIEALLREVLYGEKDIRVEVERLRQRWKRRRINTNVETEVLFEDNKKYTIIDVFAPDRIGLLYTITQAMSEMGLNIYSARIGTRLDGAADCFYVLDQEGRKIESIKRQEEIRNELTNRLAT